MAPPGFVSKNNPRAMREEFVQSFDIYGGKDAMRVISLDDSNDCPQYLKDFVKDGACLMKLSRVIETIQGTKGVPQRTERGDKPEVEYTRRELELITTLQRQWKRILPRMQEMRQLRETAEGAIMLELRQLCLTKLDTEPARSTMPHKAKVAIRAFIFEDALSIIIDLSKTRGAIQRLREIVKRRLASTQTFAGLEELLALPRQFVHFESRLRCVSDVFSINVLEPNLFAVNEMQLEACDARQVLSTVKDGIQSIESKLSISEAVS